MHLFGREREHADVVDRLEDHRLVTVVGPGGIGKTALARAVAAEQGGAYALGSHFVDLTRVDAGEAVGAAMAAQLGFSSFRALIDSPSEQPVLLVVDNCEHVLDGAAEAIDALLGACMAPAVVATSRSPLDLPGESVVVLGPLAQAGAAGASVDLFLARAKEAGASLNEDQAESIADLCAALDGVPLALEIAAARTRVLTPAEIHDRLDDLDTLSRPRTRGSERHRTVRATIEWSYRQLDDDEQRFFDRLGMFTGAFTPATAHDVAAEPDDDPIATLDRLEALVRASLVTVEASTERTCYRLLHTVRTFARERLEARGEAEATARRFVAHLLATTVPLGHGGRDRWDAGALRELLDRADDVVAGLRWTTEHDEEADASLALLSALWSVVHQGRTDDLATVGERVLDRWPDPTGPEWADAVATLATAWHLLGRSEEAVDLAERGLAAADGARLAPVTLRRVLGQARAAHDDTAGALAAFTPAEAAARERGLAPLARELRVYRAALETDADLDGALAALRDAHDEAAAAGDIIIQVWAQVNEGYLLLNRDPDEAARTLQAALDLARAKGYRAGTVNGLLGLAIAAVLRERPREGAPLLVELIDEITLQGAVADIGLVLHTSAAVLLAAGGDDVGALVATSDALPRVSFFGPSTRRLLPLPPTSARALSTGGAISWSRAALVALDQAAAPSPASDPEPSEDHGRLRLDGSLWHLSWAGQDLTLRASKGMADLARLLGSPDEEVHCLELAGAAVDQGSTGEILDATARRAYEDRIRELQAEIDEAEADNDLGRADRAQVEFDALVEHLASALGLGGRARRGGSTAERARSAVTHRIRSTLRKIGATHPDLGRHLEASIRTGTYCSYRPERPTTWTS